MTVQPTYEVDTHQVLDKTSACCGKCVHYIGHVQTVRNTELNGLGGVIITASIKKCKHRPQVSFAKHEVRQQQ
jgi:hypothetical protein